MIGHYGILAILLVILVGLLIWDVWTKDLSKAPKKVQPKVDDEYAKMRIEASSTDTILAILDFYKYNVEGGLSDHDNLKIARLENELLFRYNSQLMGPRMKQRIELYFDEFQES